VRDLAIHHPRSSTGRYVTVAIGFATAIPPWGETENALLQSAEADIEKPAERPGQLEAG
jgi:hypothetical protein